MFVTKAIQEFLSAAEPQSLIDVCRLKHFVQTHELAPEDIREKLRMYMESKQDNVTIETRSCQDKSDVHTETSKELYKDNDIEKSLEDNGNYQIERLIEDLELLDKQIKSNAVFPLDLSEDQTKKFKSLECRLSRSSYTFIRWERPVGKRNQNQKMKETKYLDHKILEIENQVLHSPLKEVSDRYKHPRRKVKICWNICLFLGCSFLQEDIVMIIRQFDIWIYSEHIHLAICMTFATRHNENRSIEENHRNARLPQDGNCRMLCNVKEESCIIKQEKCEPRMHIVEKMLTKNRPSAHRSTNSENKVWKLFKLFMGLYVMLALLGSGNTAHLDREVSNTKMVQSKQLLRTINCNHETLYNLNKTCQTNDELRNELIGFCKFRELCTTEEEPVCIDSEGTGLFVCLEKELECAKGYMMKAAMGVMDLDSVNLQIQKCPKGSFQSYESDCLHACDETHRDLKHISEKYIVHSEGNNVSPAVVYCNYKKGYFNKEGKFLLNYDEEQYNPFFCMHTSQYKQCQATQLPLPNGTCSDLCGKGYLRDDNDGFKCKPIQVHQLPSSSFAPEVTVRSDNEEGILTTISYEKDDKKISTLVVKALIIGGIVFTLVLIVVVVLVFRNKNGRKCTLPFFIRKIQEGRNIGSKYSKTDVDDDKSSGELYCADTHSGVEKPLMKENRDTGTPRWNTKMNYNILKKNEKKDKGKTCSKSIFKMEEFKKCTDDTNTQTVVSSLYDCMTSCGALIYKKKVSGTVFRVGTRFIMTAFHVIRDIIKDPTGKQSYIYSKLENSDDVTVNFNASICSSSRRKFRLKYRFHDEQLDVAVLEIMNTTWLKDFPKGLLLWRHDIVHLTVKKISMIGFGHACNPFEKHLETCEIIQDFQVRYMEALARLGHKRQEYIDDGIQPSSVDLGYQNLDCDALIKFDCFMAKGLSGAPILTNDGNSTKVIGIVLGGKPDFYCQLSSEKRNSFEERYLFEVGMKMEMIYESIVSKDQTLAEQLFF